MSDQIHPVFTAEEWKNPPDSYSLCSEWDGHEPAIMALANNSLLPSNPYKLTRADVEALLDEAVSIGSGGLSSRRDDISYLTQAKREARLTKLAEKIAALLPPA